MARWRWRWWMARRCLARPLLSTSSLCVFPPPSLLWAVRRSLCQRLLVVLVLGPDGMGLAPGLGLRPIWLGRLGRRRLLSYRMVDADSLPLIPAYAGIQLE